MHWRSSRVLLQAPTLLYYRIDLSRGIIQVTWSAKVSLRHTYRKKLRRQFQRLDQARNTLLSDASIPPSAYILVTQCITELRSHIAVTKGEWLRSKQRRLFRSHTWWDNQTKKRFFQRISCKFVDNMIPTLRPVQGLRSRNIHEKANILADAWSPGFQGTPRSPHVSSFVEWM